ncbi:secretin and TonB N-terminal domain-containing protein [bacterium]|nr:secretin and TonB N-terminal domain-containing protein [bacterium]
MKKWIWFFILGFICGCGNFIIREIKPEGLPLISKEPVSLRLDEGNIRDALDVLRGLAMKNGIIIVYGDDVKGTATMSFRKVPLDNVLRTILKMKGLVIHRISKSVLRIATPEALAQESDKKVTLVTKLFHFNYTTATNIKAELKYRKRLQGTQTIINVDERSNTLIVTTTLEMLEDITMLIKELDVKNISNPR